MPWNPEEQELKEDLRNAETEIIQLQKENEKIKNGLSEFQKYLAQILRNVMDYGRICGGNAGESKIELTMRISAKLQEILDRKKKEE